MRQARAFRRAAPLVALLAACTSNLALPPDPMIGCESDAECPGGLVCLADTLRCVARDSPCVVEGDGAHQPVADGEPCRRAGSEDHGVCRAGVCAQSACGDGIVDLAAGEACDDAALNDDAWSLRAHCGTRCRPAPHCGDGVLDATEACDDGPANSDAWGARSHCNSTCTRLAPFCGDANVDRTDGEACDDGAKNSDLWGTRPHCRADCSAPAPACGDGVRDPEEECDDGAANRDGWSLEARCGSTCKRQPYCGDGRTDPGERCDEGAGNGDGWSRARHCAADCAAFAPYCGDGNVDRLAGEACDDGARNNDLWTAQAHCRADCTAPAPFCGDGVRDPEEECDEGAANRDGWGLLPHCGTACTRQAYCGDGRTDPGEACDDGAANSDAWGRAPHCNATCSGKAPWCGDGNVDRTAGEACDDGAQNSELWSLAAHCRADCSAPAPSCGDGVKQPEEECDAGAANRDGWALEARCGTTCKAQPYCGDGKQDAAEACDEGAKNSDTWSRAPHCDARCAGLAPHCGDAVVDARAGEVCDDGPANSSLWAPKQHCRGDCSGFAPWCGDATVDPEESCDDGAKNADAWGLARHCRADCKGAAPFCGDATVDALEVCDGGAANSDAWAAQAHCDATCSALAPYCGDGFVDGRGGEVCDEGTKNSNDWAPAAHCKADCKGLAPYCGDRTKDPGETCDDGAGNSNGWAVAKHCNADCSALGPFCGDKLKQAAEACDDGYFDACGTCNATCSGAGAGSVCRDNVLCPETEQCDVGGESASCNSNCTPALCGDGVLNRSAEEACDDGQANGDAWRFERHCRADCSALAPYCGDGLTDANEQCDGAGETAACNADCTTARCGDGKRNLKAGEVCDDGPSGSATCSPSCTSRPALAVGGSHSCFLLPSGRLKCWGVDDNGQLGLGEVSTRGDTAGEMGDALPPVELGTGRLAVAVSASDAHTCAVLDDGSVRCWGMNSAGQLGLGDTVMRGNLQGQMGDALPAIALDGRAVAVAAGGHHTCALLEDRRVKCWGQNFYGQLGVGDVANRGDGPGEMGAALPAVNLGTGRTAKAIAAGAGTSCALLDDDTVKCWGANTEGVLGRGDLRSRGGSPADMGDALLAVPLGTGRRATAIALGGATACAVLDDRSLKCWGANGSGQLGQGDSLSRGSTLNQLGDNLKPVELGTGRKALAVAVRNTTTCALLDDGSVKCWGANTYGQLGQGDLSERGSSKGNLGDALPGVDLGPAVSAVAVGVGDNFACAVAQPAPASAERALKCWGYNFDGRLGVGDVQNRGDEPAEMGRRLPWLRLADRCGDGYRSPGEVCDDGFQDACGTCNAACTGPGSGAACGDGVVCPEREACDDGPQATATCDADCTRPVCGDGVRNVAAGEACDDGHADACGSCDATCTAPGLGGGCGDGSFCSEVELCDATFGPVGCTASCAPSLRVYGAGDFLCAVRPSGRVKCWGAGSFGQLGVDDTRARGNAPGQMGSNLPYAALDRPVVSMGVGGGFACALFPDATVSCWGANSQSQLALGKPTANRGDFPGEMASLGAVALGTGLVPVELSANNSAACARFSNGALKCWGTGLGVGAGLAGSIGDSPSEIGDGMPALNLGTGRTARVVRLGTNHTCAVLDDATVKCWGGNDRGQLGLGDTASRTGPGQLGDALPRVDLGLGVLATDLALGNEYSCALLQSGGVKCWGINNFGQLGLGDTANRGDGPGEMGANLPLVDLGTGRRAVALAGGGFHVCALLDDASVKCWGYDAGGRLGQGTVENLGDQASELGDFLPPVDLGTGRKAVSLVATFSATCAVLDDSSVKCWGQNSYGQLGLGDGENHGDDPGEMGDALPAVDLGP